MLEKLPDVWETMNFITMVLRLMNKKKERKKMNKIEIVELGFLDVVKG